MTPFTDVFQYRRFSACPEIGSIGGGRLYLHKRCDVWLLRRPVDVVISFVLQSTAGFKDINKEKLLSLYHRVTNIASDILILIIAFIHYVPIIKENRFQKSQLKVSEYPPIIGRVDNQLRVST